MKKTFQYRANINKQSEINANKCLELCRQLYNICLEQKINAYRESKRTISANQQMVELPDLKVEFPEYKQVNSQILQDVVQRLDRAYQAFFHRVKNGATPGFPRFKGKNRYDSFTLKQTGWKLQGRQLHIKHVGTFKLRLSRPIEGDIKTITIRRSRTGKWFIAFSCDNVSNNLLPKTNNQIGIDVGCESFLTDSNGDKIDNPRFTKQSQDLLKFHQQSLSRKKRGSNRRRKAKIFVAKTHEKIQNQRKDFHFKTANQLVQNNDVIYIEDMSAWTTEYRKLNKSMRDVAWFGFFEILGFKAAEAGRQVIKVPAKNTSQRCSNCNQIVKKDLSVRTHNCVCGLILDRDHNAAINILMAGQAIQAHA